MRSAWSRACLAFAEAAQRVAGAARVLAGSPQRTVTYTYPSGTEVTFVDLMDDGDEPQDATTTRKVTLS